MFSPLFLLLQIPINRRDPKGLTALIQHTQIRLMMRNNCYVFVQLIRPRPVVMWQEYRAFKVRFSSFLYSSTCKLLKMTLKCWLLQAVYIHILPVSPLWGQGLLDVQLSCTRSVSSCVAAFCYKMLIIAAVFDGFSSNWGGGVSPAHSTCNLTFFPASYFLLGSRWKTGRRGNGQEERPTS